MRRKINFVETNTGKMIYEEGKRGETIIGTRSQFEEGKWFCSFLSDDKVVPGVTLTLKELRTHYL